MTPLSQLPRVAEHSLSLSILWQVHIQRPEVASSWPTRALQGHFRTLPPRPGLQGWVHCARTGSSTHTPSLLGFLDKISLFFCPPILLFVWLKPTWRMYLCSSLQCGRQISLIFCLSIPIREMGVMHSGLYPETLHSYCELHMDLVDLFCPCLSSHCFSQILSPIHPHLLSVSVSIVDRASCIPGWP